MLTKAMQCQYLADLLAGLPRTRRRAREFAEPWRTIYNATVDLPAERRQAGLQSALAAFDEPQRRAIISEILALTPGRTLPGFPSLHDIAADLEPVRWLWKDWIPLAMLSLLGAVPGAGKSYLSLDLAKRIIAGEPWPDGQPMAPIVAGRPVLYIDAENVPQLINERAEHWQLDRRRLYLMLPDDSEILDLSAEKYRDRLVEMMHAINPALIIVDSLSSISSKGENNVEDVRSLLSFLNAVAGSFECGILLIHHLRKHSALPLLENEMSADDFRGSSHIIAMARSVLGMNIVKTGPELDRNGPRKLQIVKTNLAAYPDPLGCRFVPMHPSGVLLQWGEAPEEYEAPTKGDECGAWLLDLLSDGEEMRPKDIIDLGKDLGYGRATIFRARDELGSRIINTKGRKDPANTWRLARPDDQAND